jgi:hypothetical protein
MARFDACAQIASPFDATRDNSTAAMPPRPHSRLFALLLPVENPLRPLLQRTRIPNRITSDHYRRRVVPDGVVVGGQFLHWRTAFFSDWQRWQMPAAFSADQ